MRLQESPSFKPFPRELLVFLVIASGTGEHKVTDIIGWKSCVCNPRQGKGMIDMIDVLTLDFIKLSTSACEVIASVVLAFQLILDFLLSICPRNFLSLCCAITYMYLALFFVTRAAVGSQSIFSQRLYSEVFCILWEPFLAMWTPFLMIAVFLDPRLLSKGCPRALAFLAERIQSVSISPGLVKVVCSSWEDEKASSALFLAFFGGFCVKAKIGAFAATLFAFRLEMIFVPFAVIGVEVCFSSRKPCFASTALLAWDIVLGYSGHWASLLHRVVSCLSGARTPLRQTNVLYPQFSIKWPLEQVYVTFIPHVTLD